MRLVKKIILKGDLKKGTCIGYIDDKGNVLRNMDLVSEVINDD